MRDVMFLLLVMAFFAVATAYVRACAWVVGPERPKEADTDESRGQNEAA